ncbi:hypothetical protein [Paraliomyxa miuraensis]|nr:hypothetical protein [Paraliomyxa miuraensis]MCX4239194.1 hypothetical protein [Paraliomyxa miuraensis]
MLVEIDEHAGVYYIMDAASGDTIQKGPTEELPPHVLEALRSDPVR